jgi:uncharacterized protein with NAD-binding domain and iron-sulfur cluster
MTETPAPREKVAVLGSGVGAMVAAFALTAPEQKGRYQVTVYQMGWRLGGKGASGRNQADHYRIQEHGLHIWLGFYDNAFRVMRAVYDELARPPGAPLATVDEAFKQQSYVVLEEQLGSGAWRPWEFDFPTNGERPGDAGLVLPSVWTCFLRIMGWLSDRWSEEPALESAPAAGDSPDEAVAPFRASFAPPPAPPQVMPPWVKRAYTQAVAAAPAGATRGSFLEAVTPTSSYLGWAMEMIASLGDPATQTAGTQHALIWLIKAFMDLAWVILGDRIESDFWARKLWIEVNLAGSAAVGILRDGVLYDGWGAVDDLDFRAWLARNGANEITTGSAPVRGIYDLVFGFVGGETKDGRLSAGVAMYGILRMLLTYRGSIFWEMQAGMGDTVFGPLYEVLKRRGVTFEFFHRVSALRLDDARRSVGAIELVRQVKLAGASYEPLIPVLGLPCWPSEPLYDQLQGGDDLRASGINLESAWALRWRDEEPRRLERGRDFDQVVLGISLGGVRHVAAELAAASAPFAAMLAQVQTTQTFGWQLWLTPDLAGLGWRKGVPTHEAPVLTAFVEPVNTWGDLSHLLAREIWTGALPRSSAYFCGPFRDAARIPPPFTGDPAFAGFPAEEATRFAGLAGGFLDRDVRALWPLAVKPDGSFDRGLVVSEYQRVNIDPTERYVLSVPGTTRYRLAPGASGFDNVVLAGDWTENIINAACVEAATISGLRAARALSGVGAPIAGEPVDDPTS